MTSKIPRKIHLKLLEIEWLMSHGHPDVAPLLTAAPKEEPEEE